MKMRVAVAFILLISLAMAFTMDKERPALEDEQDMTVIINNTFY